MTPPCPTPVRPATRSATATSATLVVLAVLASGAVGRLGFIGIAATDHGTSARQGSIAASASDVPGYHRSEIWRSRRPTTRYSTLDWPEGHAPGGVGIDPLSNRFAATDRTAHTVRLYEKPGAFLDALGGPGSSVGRLRSPRDAIVLRDGRIAVSDTGNDRVQILSDLGEALAHWTVADPRGIDVIHRNAGQPGAETLLAVVSAADRRLRLFEMSGEERLSLPLAGTVEPDVLSDLDVGFGADGTPRVSAEIVDAADGRLVRVSASDGPAVLLALPGLRSARTIGRWEDSASPGAEPAAIVGVHRDGIQVLDAGGQPVDPAARLPFRTVTDMARPRRGSGRILAAVSPEGLVDLGDDPGALIDALRSDVDGRWIAPRRIAVGEETLIADALPRAARRSATGEVLPSLTIPAPPFGARAPAARDIASDGPAAYAIARDGRVLARDGTTFGRFRDPPADRPTLRWSLARRAGAEAGVVVLDVLQERLILLDPRLAPTGEVAVPGLLASDIARHAAGSYLALAGTGELASVRDDGTRVARTLVAGGVRRVAAGPDGDAFVLTDAGWVIRLSPELVPRAGFAALTDGLEPIDLDVDDRGRVLVLLDEAPPTAALDNERATDGAPAMGLPDAVAAAPRIDVWADTGSGPGAGTPPLSARPGECALLGEKAATPADVELGDVVTVTLSIAGSCHGRPGPADVILAVDRSRSMGDDGKLDAAVEAATAMALHLDPTATRLGVVSFGEVARSELTPTADLLEAARVVRRLSPGGDTNLVDAVRAARDLLMAEGRPDARRTIVMLTDGRHTVDRPALSELATVLDDVRSDGITVFAVALGGAADLGTLQRIAGGPDRLLRSPTARDLHPLFARIARRIGASRLLDRVTITDTLPADMDYVEDSAIPPAELSDDGRRLTWRLASVDGPSTAVRFQVRPSAAGIRPTNRRARATGEDALGGPLDIEFPIPTIRVRIDGRLPSPSPTRTAPATPSSRPGGASATPTAPATVEPTEAPRGTPTTTATPGRDGTPTPSPPANNTAGPTPSAPPTEQTATVIPDDGRRLYIPLAVTPP